jgi:hypothetical protein
VRIYNRALSPAELQSDMASPVGSGQPPPPPLNAATAAAGAPCRSSGWSRSPWPSSTPARS